ncbi:MAG: type IV secretion system DNA-binding domain-containing protein [Chloroflexi bacterium]|nr:type IV secretion system DNA-binding domain-containing protein [Chloroflexota bacterium]
MLRLGHTVDGNEPVELSLDERRQGTYIIGTTGTGKSTLLKNIIYQDMRNDKEHGICVLDPHGDLVDELLELVPKNRVKDVILFDPMDLERPFGLNLLACDRNDPHQVRWVVSTIMGTLRRLYSYSWGPRLEHVLRNALLTAMLLPDSTFLELTLLLSNETYRKRIVEQVKDPIVREFWNSFPRSEREKYDLISSTLNKISPFITDPSMRNIIGQPQNTIDLRKMMDEGKILFVNLSKGDLGEESSALLGSVIVNLVLISSLQRRSTPVHNRRPFHLVVDEFQNMATESFAILQSEARKYAVDVVVAHQYRDQLLDDLSRGSTLNVGNMVVLRTTGRDSYELASQFDNTPPPPEKVMEPQYKEYGKSDDGEITYIQPKSTTGVGNIYHAVERIRRTYSDMEGERANKLSISPNYEAWCRLIHVPKKGRPQLIERHILTENLGEDERDSKIAKQIRGNSRNLAKTKKEVEKDIARRSFGEIDENGGFATVEAI